MSRPTLVRSTAVPWCAVVIALAASAPPGAEAQAANSAPSSAPAAQTSEAAARPRAVQDTARPPLDRIISLELTNVPLGAALREIAAQAKLNLVYTNRVVPLKQVVSVRLTNVPARQALSDVLRGTGVEVGLISGNRVALRKAAKGSGTSSAETDSTFGAVYGQVTDTATGRPLADATVSVRGTSLATRTDEAGMYLLPRVPAGPQLITVRLLGYMLAGREVAVVDSQRVRADVALRLGMSRLPEVVTTATGERRRLELGNDIVRINADSIARTEPVTSVTDLLEGRVPGLVVQRTSGAPGDPARLRLRGAASAYLSNDPIVIVDGIRVYAAQSDTRSANLAWNPDDAADFTKYGVATPSPLDYLDPHSIETIEVMKGPSAATLYGADAANGVIVITTKRGQAGPPRWTASAERGTTYIPGSYPDSYLRWGHRTWDRAPILCPLQDLTCDGDSVSRFQTLNDPALTILAHGDRTAFALGVSGGVDALQYSINGNFEDALGVVRLPDIEVDRYRALHGGLNPPDWMRRPQRLRQWGANSRLTAKLGTRADVGISARLSHTSQQRSNLENRLRDLMGTYIDANTGAYYRPALTGLFPVTELLSEYQRHITSDATQFTNSASLNWRVRPWLTANTDVGIDIIQREDAMLLPRLAATAATDTGGAAALGRGTSFMNTVNVRAAASAPLPWGFRLQTAVGANYVRQRTADVSMSALGLQPGATSIAGGIRIQQPTESRQDQSALGVYIEPSLAHKRFWLSTGLRMDGGNTYGSRASFVTFPKVSLSYLISDEPFFPFKRAFDLLRLRVAYGQAGVQPGPRDRLRLYSSPTQSWADGTWGNGVEVSTIGNTRIRPERSTEVEGGFDADMLGDRLSLGFTGYRKMRYDALMNVPLPPSVYGDNVFVLRNIGEIRNTGYEVTLGAQLLRTDLLSWSTQLNVSHNQNVVVRLGPGVRPFEGPDGRVAAGYPLNGRWAKPVLGYTDADGNHIIDPSEILYGDTAVYVGRQEPNYTAMLSTTLALFRGALAVSAGFQYEDGLTQRAPWASMRQTLRAYNDPATPLDQQAAVVSTLSNDFLAMQTVNVLRFNSLSVAYNVPAHIAQRAGARSLTVALQGTNLGLHTNYLGKDPGVNAAATGSRVVDNGVIPQPRTWQLRVSASY